MRTTKTTMVETDVVEVVCDVCKTAIKDDAHECAACDRDICRACSSYDDRDPTDDYPGTFCKQCWAIGEKFRARQARITQKFTMEIECIEDEWYEVARAEVLGAKQP